MIFKIDNPAKINFQFSVVGLIAGIIFNIYLLSSAPVQLNTSAIVINVVFSLLITLCIANTVTFFMNWYRPDLNRFWEFIAVYYFCNLLGMAIGKEFADAFLHIIISNASEPISNFSDYRTLSLWVLTCATAILIYNIMQLDETQEICNKTWNNDASNGHIDHNSKKIKIKLSPDFYTPLALDTEMLEALNSVDISSEKLNRFFNAIHHPSAPNFHTVAEELIIVELYCSTLMNTTGKKNNILIDVQDAALRRILPRNTILAIVTARGEQQINQNMQNQQLQLTVKALPTTLEISFGNFQFDKNQFERSPIKMDMLLKILYNIYKQDFTFESESHLKRLNRLILPLI